MSRRRDAGVAGVRRALGPALLLLLAAGCVTAQNYSQPDAPRYYGGPMEAAPVTAPAVLQVVVFNIQYSVQIDRALNLLRADPALRTADIILLQEMDENGTWLIAEELGMHYAYYPGMLHLRTGRDFGNAVLSRFPIVDHSRITLPHTARFTRSQRIATAATVQVGHIPVRVYSVHLGTLVEVGRRERREQLQTVLADAARFDRVIIGGDLNSETIGAVAQHAGYEWPTATGPPTAFIWRFDHILFRGIPGVAAGTVLDRGGASDHRPVWALGALPHVADNGEIP